MRHVAGEKAMSESCNAVSPVIHAQQLTFDAFCREASVKPLENHGRTGEVYFRGNSLGFVDHLGVPALLQAHEREVNNALYFHSADAVNFGDSMTLPSAAALSEYPALRTKFPEAAAKVLREASTYEATWGESYATPGTHIVRPEFFSDSLGYDNDDVDRIGRLEVGESLTLDAGDHVVRRIG
jgi:hypothetical protein